MISSIGEYTVEGEVKLGTTPSRGENPTVVHINKVFYAGEEVDINALSDIEYAAFERELLQSAVNLPTTFL